MRKPLLVILVLAACHRPASSPTPATVGRVDALVGTPSLVRSAKTGPLVSGTDLLALDQVKTPAGAKVRINLADGSQFAVGPNSTVTLTAIHTSAGQRHASLEVLAGKFWLKVVHWTGAGESLFEVNTPNAVAGVRGTTLWGDTQVDAICALEGEVTVQSRKAPALAAAKLSAGNCAAELSQGKLAPLAPTAAQVQAYLDEVLIR